MRKSVFVGLVIFGLILVGCEGKPPPAGLKAPTDASNKEAAKQNDEGVSHLAQRHFDTAEGFFKKAVNADPNLAEAHFNLALSLHLQSKHTDATPHFKKAKSLAPDNSKITGNQLLIQHLR